MIEREPPRPGQAILTAKRKATLRAMMAADDEIADYLDSGQWMHGTRFPQLCEISNKGRALLESLCGEPAGLPADLTPFLS